MKWKYIDGEDGLRAPNGLRLVLVPEGEQLLLAKRVGDEWEKAEVGEAFNAWEDVAGDQVEWAHLQSFLPPAHWEHYETPEHFPGFRRRHDSGAVDGFATITTTDDYVPFLLKRVEAGWRQATHKEALELPPHTLQEITQEGFNDVS